MLTSTSKPQISVIVPVGPRHAEPVAFFQEQRRGLDLLGQSYEVIFVIDGPNAPYLEAVRALAAREPGVKLVALTRYFGEATALMAGFEQASGDVILTLPAYHQVEPEELPKLLPGLEKADVVVARRVQRAGGACERMRRGAFHGLVSWVTKMQVTDLGCGVRAIRRRVFDEISLYGDLHRFIPVLANHQGFRVAEVELKQSPKDRFEGTYLPREYFQRLLDIFTVFFLVRFTKKPLRFFGMVGATTFALGLLLLLVMVVQRQFFDQGLADRPALLLASLLVVLGLQVFALGLLGELIIFAHARALKEYQVEFVYQRTDLPVPHAPVDVVADASLHERA